MHFLTEAISLSKAIFIILTIIIWILYTLYDVNTVTWNQRSPDIPAIYSSSVTIVTYHRHSRNNKYEYYSSSFQSLHDQMSSSSSTDLPVSPALDHEFHDTPITFQSVTKLQSSHSSSVDVTRKEVKTGQQ